MRWTLLLLWLLVGACVPSEPVTGQMRVPPQPQTWEVIALRYATSAPGPRSALIQGASGQVAPDWMTWVVRGHGRVMVIDPGFDDPELAQSLAATVDVTPVAALAEIGIAPEDVTDVLLTHVRPFRAQALTRFPNARVVVQAGHLQHARAYVTQGEAARRKLDPALLAQIEALDQQGRVLYTDTSVELEPGLQVHAQWLLMRWIAWYAVRTERGVVVIAGDLVPLADSLREGPPPEADRELWWQTAQTMQLLAGSDGVILPGDDASVLEGAERMSEHAWRVGGP